MNFNFVLKKYKNLIDKELDSFFENNTNIAGLNYSFMKEYLKGGKRLRPIMLIMAYNGVKGFDDRILKAALSVELLHNSTLVHDDVMDEDDFRRGKPSVHKRLIDRFNYLENQETKLFKDISVKFGVSNAILIGNILYALGSYCLANSNFDAPLLKDALKVYHRTYKLINHGQMLDLIYSLSETSEKEYIEMIRLKTAYLFKACVQIGIILGNGTKEQLNLLGEYAENLGIGFQLEDDILDISYNMEKGHELGSDIREGKRTIIVIKALEVFNSQDRKLLLRCLGNKNLSQEKIIKVIKIFNKYGIINYVNDIAKSKIERAKLILSKINISEETKKFFSELADYVISRRK